MPRDFTANFDDDDLMEARNSRNSAVRRPDLDPGMGDDDDEWGGFGSSNDDGWGSGFGNKGGSSFGGGPSPFGDSSSFGGGPSPFGDSSSFGGGGSNPFGGGPQMSGPNPFGGTQMSGFSRQYGTPGGLQNQQNQGEKAEDKFWRIVLEGFKKIFGFASDFISSFSSFDQGRRVKFGRNLVYTSIGIIILAGILTLKIPFVYTSQLLIAGFLSAAFSTPFFMISFANVEENPQLVEDDDFNMDMNMNNEENFSNEEDFDGFNEEDSEKSEDSVFDTFSGFADFEDDDNDSDSIFTKETYDYSQEIESEKADVDDVLEKLEDLDSSLIPRQYIYENMVSVLDSNKSDFEKEITFSEESREFNTFVKFVQIANKQLKKGKGDDLQVESVKDRLFYTTLVLSRPSWIKMNVTELVNEIVNQYANDGDSFETDKNITGTGRVAGEKIFIRIMKGETAMVTVRDVMEVKKKEILDTKNKMPVVIGIDQNGAPMLVDFSQFHSLLVAGAPRSGKSWAVKAMLGQIMMFSSPNDVQFYFADPKNTTSDYFTMGVPHIRKFVSSNQELLKTVDYLVNTVAPQRSQTMLEMGAYKDIRDLKKEHPEMVMPYIYLVIDEIATFTSSMAKEELDAFNKLLRNFATRLPSYGIRLILVPHIVKNQIIDKTTSSMIKNRFCVRGTPEDIENTLDISKKEFPIRLNYPGDMAVHLDGVTTSGPIFLHSAIVAKDNGGYEKFFNFLTNWWLRVDFDSFKGSKLEKDILMGSINPKSYPIIKDKLDEDEYSELLKTYERNKGKFLSGDYEESIDKKSTAKTEKSTRIKRPSKKKETSFEISDDDDILLSDDEQKSFYERANFLRKNDEEDFF